MPSLWGVVSLQWQLSLCWLSFTLPVRLDRGQRLASCRRMHLACVVDLDEALEKWVWEGLRLSLMAAERQHSGLCTPLILNSKVDTFGLWRAGTAHHGPPTQPLDIPCMGTSVPCGPQKTARKVSQIRKETTSAAICSGYVAWTNAEAELHRAEHAREGPSNSMG